MKRYVILFAAMATMVACELSSNPFDGEIDPSVDHQMEGFAAIHANILEPKCANPACHDGTFEPDFRTVEGSYNTLVYHDVSKNDDNSSFRYRVLPGEPSSSWLIHRIKYANDTLGRMPLYAEPLSQKEIKSISDWISDGAKDVRDNDPLMPNAIPSFDWYVAFAGDVDWNNWYANRVDENRTEWPNPFYTNASDTIRFLFHMVDDHTLTADLTDFKFYLSDNPEHSDPSVYYPEYFVADYWTLVFPPNSFEIGDTHYFHLEFSDGEHTAVSPDENAPWWYVNNRSFYLK